MIKSTAALMVILSVLLSILYYIIFYVSSPLPVGATDIVEVGNGYVEYTYKGNRIFLYKGLMTMVNISTE